MSLKFFAAVTTLFSMLALPVAIAEESSTDESRTGFLRSFDPETFRAKLVAQIESRTGKEDDAVTGGGHRAFTFKMPKLSTRHRIKTFSLRGKLTKKQAEDIVATIGVQLQAAAKEAGAKSTRLTDAILDRPLYVATIHLGHRTSFSPLKLIGFYFHYEDGEGCQGTVDVIAQKVEDEWSISGGLIERVADEVEPNQ